MDLAAIKVMLHAAGIRNLAVRFDDPNRQIIATFTHGGEKHERTISFSEIEKLFTEGPFQAHRHARADVPSISGIG